MIKKLEEKMNITKTIVLILILNISSVAMGQNEDQSADIYDSSEQASIITANLSNFDWFNGTSGNGASGNGASGILYDNGPLITSVGTGVGGIDESILEDATLNMTTFGSAHSGNFRVSDEFTVDTNEWNITTITFFAYQTGETASTITEVNLQIWDGIPGEAGSSVIFGDETTNRMSTTQAANILRVTEADTGTDSNRQIAASVVDVNMTLPMGTYWLDWQANGSGASGPWAPPITIPGQTVTGNALQLNAGVWGDLLDGGSGTALGLPFIIQGSTGFTIGGMVSGLVGSGLTLQNNGGDDLAISADGGFTFPAALNDGSAYTVTVLNQPTVPSQTCTVTNDSGTLTGINVTNVMVNCTTNTYTVGGTISGLATGNSVVLLNNAGDNLTVNADGSFTFATALIDRSAYAVTVLTDPTTPNQVCTITNGTGNLAGADVTDVMVNCMTDTHTISGVVSGLAGSGLTLQSNGNDDLTVNADGGFTFATALADGSAYAVTVLTQPTSPDQTCTVSNGSGTLMGANVTNVIVNCSTDTFSVGGSISGLTTGNSVTLQNNATDDLIITADGGFTFATALADGSVYDVTVLNQLFRGSTQTCSVVNNTGQINGANVSNIAVSCIPNTPTIQLSSAFIDFNTVTINDTANGVITITNIGTGDLNMSVISTPAAPFSTVGGSCLSLPVVLIPSASCDIEVMFSPTAVGTFNDVIDLTSDAASSPDQIIISGSAVGSSEPVSVPTLNSWLLMFLTVLILGGVVLQKRHTS